MTQILLSLLVWGILSVMLALVIGPTMAEERRERAIQREKDEATREQRLREKQLAAVIDMGEHRARRQA